MEITALKCLNVGTIIFSSSVINTALEIIIAVLPIPYIFSVKMDRRQRLSIMSLLCLGILVFILGIVRCRFVYIALISSNDVTWWAGPHWTVSEVENNVAIICACAPALRPVLGRLFSDGSVNPSHGETEGSLYRPLPIPALKPKQYIDYPRTRDVTYFDIEGIADDGRGHTFVLHGDSETTCSGYQSNMETQSSRKGFFSRIRQWFSSDNHNLESHQISQNYSYRTRSEADDNETTERLRGIAEKMLEIDPRAFPGEERKVESPWRPDSVRSNDINPAELPWIDVVNGRYLPSPPPPAHNVAHNPEDYLSWAKMVDPSKRLSPTRPLNASHSGSKSSKKV